MITGILIIFLIIVFFPYGSSKSESRKDNDSDWWDSFFLWVLLSDLFKSTSDRENNETYDPDDDYDDED